MTVVFSLRPPSAAAPPSATRPPRKADAMSPAARLGRRLRCIQTGSNGVGLNGGLWCVNPRLSPEASVAITPPSNGESRLNEPAARSGVAERARGSAPPGEEARPGRVRPLAGRERRGRPPAATRPGVLLHRRGRGGAGAGSARAVAAGRTRAARGERSAARRRLLPRRASRAGGGAPFRPAFEPTAEGARGAEQDAE